MLVADLSRILNQANFRRHISGKDRVDRIVNFITVLYAERHLFSVGVREALLQDLKFIIYS